MKRRMISKSIFVRIGTFCIKANSVTPPKMYLNITQNRISSGDKYLFKILILDKT